MYDKIHYKLKKKKIKKKKNNNSTTINESYTDRLNIEYDI